MLNVRIVKGRSEIELQKNANEALSELQSSGYKIVDTDVAGRADDSGEVGL